MKQIVIYGSGFSAMIALQTLKARSLRVLWVRPTRDTALPLLPGLSAPLEGSLLGPLLNYQTKDILRSYHPKGFGPFEGVELAHEAMLCPVEQWLPEPGLMELEAEWEAEAHLPHALIGCERSTEGWTLRLSNGTLITASHLVLAENKRKLRDIGAIPRYPVFEAHSVIQLRYQHYERALRLECPLQFCSKLIRPEKKEVPRKLWGYFAAGCRQSRWSLLISEDERDHYPSVAKLIRRMRASLERSFRDVSWEGSERVGWASNLVSEQIRIEEDALTTEAIFTEPKRELCVLHPETPLESQLRALENWYRSEIGDLPIRSLEASLLGP
jgi:hypothetical protein